MTTLPDTPASRLTPGLLDLVEHEKVIEQGLNTFVEVGAALLTIRDGRKYRAAGFATFEAYCRDRWSMSPQRAGQLIAATEVAELLPMETVVSISEGSLRPLARQREALGPAGVAEAFAEAVEASNGKPTARHVEEAVAKRVPPKKDHPAPFSNDILDIAAKQLAEVGVPQVVVDPFAGTGRVHELRERAGVPHTIGVELEPEWAAKHPDTIVGNALALSETITEQVDAIVTSPTYGNRMADHHDATDDSTRLTYKHSLGRDLNEDNSGQMQWGDDYREFHRKAWIEAVAVLKPGGTLTLNIKNHVRGGVVQRVAEWHINTLVDLGMRLVALDVVPTRGLMAGANHDRREPVELVATFRSAA